MARYLLEGIGISLALTLFLELFYAFILRIRGKKLIPVLLVNLLTNPPVVLLALTVVDNIFGRIIMELAVIAIEGYIYYSFEKVKEYAIDRPFLKSIMLNAFSYGMGGVISFIVSLLRGGK